MKIIYKDGHVDECPQDQELHGLCYSIHGECVVLSVWFGCGNLTITQDDSFVSLFIQLCNTSIVILQWKGKLF